MGQQIPPMQPITNSMRFPRAKQTWVTMELETGEYVMVEGVVESVDINEGHKLTPAQSRFILESGHIDSMNPTEMSLHFKDGFRIHKTTAPVTLDMLIDPKVATESVKSTEIDAAAKRRFNLT